MLVGFFFSYIEVFVEFFREGEFDGVADAFCCDKSELSEFFYVVVRFVAANFYYD